MPFTPSHAAAAVPFLRTRLVASALVIGCFAPDFSYFIQLTAEGKIGHTLVGVFVFDLPLSLLALWLFHSFAKEPLYAWLPESLQRRIHLRDSVWPIRSGRRFGLVVLSILVGVATHIVWDSFTHRAFYPYQHWAFLRRTIHLPLVGSLEYLRVLQHGSTVLGAIVLVVWFWRWYRRTAPIQGVQIESQKGEIGVLVLICFLAIIAGVLRGIQEYGVPREFSAFKYFTEDAVITTISSFWLGVVAYGALRRAGVLRSPGRQMQSRNQEVDKLSAK